MKMMRVMWYLKRNPPPLANNRTLFPLPCTLTHPPFQSHLWRVRMRHWNCGMNCLALQSKQGINCLFIWFDALTSWSNYCVMAMSSL